MGVGSDLSISSRINQNRRNVDNGGNSGIEIFVLHDGTELTVIYILY